MVMCNNFMLEAKEPSQDIEIKPLVLEFDPVQEEQKEKESQEKQDKIKAFRAKRKQYETSQQQYC